MNWQEKQWASAVAFYFTAERAKELSLNQTDEHGHFYRQLRSAISRMHSGHPRSGGGGAAALCELSRRFAIEDGRKEEERDRVKKRDRGSAAAWEAFRGSPKSSKEPRGARLLPAKSFLFDRFATETVGWKIIRIYNNAGAVVGSSNALWPML